MQNVQNIVAANSALSTSIWERKIELEVLLASAYTTFIHIFQVCDLWTHQSLVYTERLQAFNSRLLQVHLVGCENKDWKNILNEFYKLQLTFPTLSRVFCGLLKTFATFALRLITNSIKFHLPFLRACVPAALALTTSFGCCVFIFLAMTTRKTLHTTKFQILDSIWEMWEKNIQTCQQQRIQFKIIIFRRHTQEAQKSRAWNFVVFKFDLLTTLWIWCERKCKFLFFPVDDCCCLLADQSCLPRNCVTNSSKKYEKKSSSQILKNTLCCRGSIIMPKSRRQHPSKIIIFNF